MRGTFTSFWSNGQYITTPAELNEVTGEVRRAVINTTNNSTLVSEYFTDEDGNEYRICPHCHDYIEKTMMVDGVGKTLEEKMACSDSECASHSF